MTSGALHSTKNSATLETGANDTKISWAFSENSNNCQIKRKFFLGGHHPLFCKFEPEFLFKRKARAKSKGLLTFFLWRSQCKHSILSKVCFLFLLQDPSRLSCRKVPLSHTVDLLRLVLSLTPQDSPDYSLTSGLAESIKFLL